MGHKTNCLTANHFQKVSRFLGSGTKTLRVFLTCAKRHCVTVLSCTYFRHTRRHQDRSLVLSIRVHRHTDSCHWLAVSRSWHPTDMDYSHTRPHLHTEDLEPASHDRVNVILLFLLALAWLQCFKKDAKVTTQNVTKDRTQKWATTLDLSLPTSGGRPFCRAMVERCYGPSWLRDNHG